MNKYYEKLYEDMLEGGCTISFANEFDTLTTGKYINMGSVVFNNSFREEPVSNRVIRLEEAPFDFLAKLTKLIDEMKSRHPSIEVHNINMLRYEIATRIEHQANYNANLLESIKEEK